MNPLAPTVLLDGRPVKPVIRAPKLPVDPLGIVGLLLVFVLWWVATSFGWASQMFLPAPGGVFHTIADNFFSSDYLVNYRLGEGGLLQEILYTTSNVIFTLIASCIIGATLGVSSARFGLLRALVDPIMLTAGTIPILVTAPFFLIWFGISRSAQIALLIIYEVTIVYLFAQRAANNLDPTYAAAGRMLGANPRRVLFDIVLMGALPEVLGGVRIAMAGAWGLETFSELLGAPHGVGRVIQAMGTAMDTTFMVATILTLAVVAVGCDGIVAGLFAYITRWKRVARL